ncbi:hypothetical protein [Elizabethkingia ursingii]|uniref:hypothetical protein n=1 Tax=Elizabethkingia ursingii TaxID=1756150 RepID=UPI000750C289|nr:hypothetical protein [Elizabethkingia ursingii]KUY29884.1 hypothetical protein ATB96_17560 [Elizabethkingia ursingii]
METISATIELNYDHLLGKRKDEILKELGEGFNYYPDDVWTYVLKQNWWGKKTALLLRFESENVIETKIFTYVFENKLLKKLEP